MITLRLQVAAADVYDNEEGAVDAAIELSASRTRSSTVPDRLPYTSS